jgi:PAP2 superfamily
MRITDPFIGGAKRRARSRGLGPRGELALVAGGVGAYTLAHRRAPDHEVAAFDHARQVLRFEGHLGIACELAVQRLALRSDAVRLLANGVYTWTYWPVLVGALVSLWRHDRRRYRILRDGMFLSGLAGLVVFIYYPVAPPRMLPGFVDTIAPDSIEHAVVHGTLANPYAALPSFHAGWFTLAAIMLADSNPQRLALPAAVAATAAMSAAVVITANHYVVDVAAGTALSFAGAAVAARLLPWHATT